MVYPDKLLQTDSGLSLYVPDANLVESVYRKTLIINPETPFPFWAKIWPAAKAMAAFLHKEPQWITNKKVLEIGAGIGLPSFTIADKTSSIIISDHSSDAIELIQKNINYLKINNATAICLDWNDFPSNIIADTILLSDINYDPTQFEALNQLIQFLLNQGTTIIIATPQRIMATPFVQLLQPNIKKMYTQEVQHDNQVLAISICLLH
ncbi:MAG: methyltransferase domain-containing protein [Sphingobacteriia bacterium]|jgi:predicted nicotinamide N-methyase